VSHAGIWTLANPEYRRNDAGLEYRAQSSRMAMAPRARPARNIVKQMRAGTPDRRTITSLHGNA